MNSPDPRRSRAVLIGVDDYTSTPGPGSAHTVAATVDRLAELVTDPRVWGLDPAHCTVLHNPPDPALILDAVYEASDGSDSLLVYLAGQAVFSTHNADLQFVLPGSARAQAFRALSYDELLSQLVGTSKAAKRAVILDCCYSGRPLHGHDGEPVHPAARSLIDGVYLMTAMAESTAEWAPPDEHYTAFTGDLIRALETGLPDAADQLDLTELYESVRRSLVARGRPAPRHWAGRGVPPMTMFRNTYRQERPVRDTTMENALPEAPEGLAAELGNSASAFAAKLHDLRTSGQGEHAESLLAAVAAQGGEAEIALLLVLLRLEHRDREADRALSVVATRPVAQTAEVALGLIRLGNGEECARLLAAVARRSAVDVAQLARRLSAQGLEAETALLLAEASGHAAMRSAIPSLALALIDAGLAAQAWPALWSALREWSEDRVLAAAEELDAAGAAPLAYSLYAHAGRVIAGNWPPDRVSGLMRRMVEAGANDALAQLLDAAVQVSGPYPSSAAYLATALAGLGMADIARRFLGEAAANLADPELEALTSYLDAGRQSALSVHAFSVAAVGRPAQATIGYVDALRRHGQPANADKLLTTVVSARPALAVGLLTAFRGAGRLAEADRLLDLIAGSSAAVCGAVARELWNAAAHNDVERLLAGIGSLPLAELVSAIAAFDIPGAPTSSLLDTRLLERRPEEFVEAVAALRQRGHEEPIERLFKVLTGARAPLVCAVALGLARARFPREAGGLLDYYSANARPADVAALFVLLYEAGGDGTGIVIEAVLTGRPDSGPVFAAFRQAGVGEAAGRHLARLALALPAPSLVPFCVSLAAQGAEDEVDVLLTQCATRDDWEDMRAGLHQAGRHVLAYHLAERRAERTGTG